jgi:hypothetical protein
MSNYQAKTKHPITGEWEVADWHDDYFGKHIYGVKFPNDPKTYNIDEYDMPKDYEEKLKGGLREEFEKWAKENNFTQHSTVGSESVKMVADWFFERTVPKDELFKKMDEYEYHKDEVHCTCLGALREWIINGDEVNL